MRRAFTNCALKFKSATDGKRNFLFIKDPKGGYHAFVEVAAQNALIECGAKRGSNTRQTARQFLGI